MLICRDARDRYSFEPALFQTDGHLNLEDYQTTRKFASRMSQKHGDPVPVSDIYALTVLDEALRFIFNHYISRNPRILRNALETLRLKKGEQTQEALAGYIDGFPSLGVYQGEMSPEDYLASVKEMAEETIRNVILTDTANRNPALQPYEELQDDTTLKKRAAYVSMLDLLIKYFKQQPAINLGGVGGNQNLIEALSAPAKASPESLEGQLKFILDHWGELLSDEIKQKLLRSMDFIREDIIRRLTGPEPLAKAAIPIYGDELEYERYSQDREWMPKLILIAKNSYVWLEQLSRKYLRWIRTLDQIPDEELQLLASRGFTGLWLIGLWERSKASQRIKQRMGDADAVASAYSLDSYDISADLGGWEALQNLRSRAWQHGIRLSADMVPNHMGIDSKWVIEHPDWFLSLPYAPYPSYSFSSENLADDDRVGIYLEDHYYNHSDAAVVFQRRDHHTGDLRFIYHGNDGTSFPWNDTAQLDYTKAEVRESVIQAILHVARNFPIIRFDAAMTLAKKHIHRLWFPEPGAGGAIPSRSEHGMPRNEFDQKIPIEFWREVVDRIAAEVPDTLLLAEAFWLLEGYFVRTLGMHRVYNSAFMHMLRDEDNAKYRQLIKSTLEFDPQILKRYVNFMSNPDEKTAVEQFGTGDKYFGVCTLLATLPGLPMIGHGQIEGFREKYGMEFRKPKWDEEPDQGLILGHEWKIFPLLKRRSLFAEVDSFYLFDFFTSGGFVNEDVFAFTNRQGNDRALVIYQNKFATTSGWVKTSAAALDKTSGKLQQTTLGDALGLARDGFVVFRDYVTHLEYIRPCAELWNQGIYIELNAYQCHAFLDWRFVTGDLWMRVCSDLEGRGVESIQDQWDRLSIDQQPETEQDERSVGSKESHGTRPSDRAEEKRSGKPKNSSANKTEQ